jgi:transposase
MDEATKREIIKLRIQGNTYPQISNLVGYGLKSIQKVIGENAPELAEMRVPRISIDKKRAIARDYYGGMTCEEVHAKHGVGYVSINQIAKEFRAEYGGKKPRGRRDGFTDEQIAQIKAEIEGGLSLRGAYNKWCITGEQLFLYGIIKTLPPRAKLQILSKK